MKRIRLVAFITFVLLAFSARAQLIINEIMTSNATTLMDYDYYNFPDWVEIYNSGTTSVNLSDYYLSDESGNLKKWRLPSTTLNSNQYYLVYCDKEASGRHTDFGLSTDGETVYLCDASGNVIDYVEYDQQFSDVSYGRNPSDQNKWHYCSNPTPEKVNVVSTAIKQGNKAQYSVSAGIINSVTSLSLSGNNIRYTTDGAVPTESSTAYSDPINLNHTIIIKTKTFQDGYLPGETYANTYFYNEHTFTLPVVSLSFNPDYFYHQTYGIHVVGVNGIANACGSIANWNQDWERAAYLEYFDEEMDKEISQPVGVKLAGGCTRGRDQKSMSIYARSKYGDNDFDHPVFKQKPEITRYKSFLLRNSGNDQDQTLLRDAFIQALINKSMDIDYQSYQPTIVYFNGEYRGIMNLREKVDEDYFQSNYALGSDDVDFLEYNLSSTIKVLRGSDSSYNEILSYITSNNLSDDIHYQYIASQFDIQEYINYLTLQIYIGNRDWPENNVKFWKKKENGIWRWVLFDTDYGLGFRMDEANHPTFDVMYSDNDGRPWSTFLFQKMMNNEGFKTKFLSTFITHMNSSFHPNWFKKVLDSLAAVIDYEISYNQEKYFRTKSQWISWIEVLEDQAEYRYSYMLDYVPEFFDFTSDSVQVSISNPDAQKGKVRVNHALLQLYPFSMYTYEELPLTIEAVPEKGFKFSHWESEGSTYSNKSLIKSDSSYTISLTPVFETIENTDNIYLNELASTTALFRDERDEKSGYIELYNNTANEAVLYSFFLSDDKSNPGRYAIPDSTVIPANGFIYFYADGDAKQGDLHTPFKLSTNGEPLLLSQKVGKTYNILDSVTFTFLAQNYSFGKYTDGTGNWQYMKNLTPGLPNDPEEPIIGVETTELAHNFVLYPNPSKGLLHISTHINDIGLHMYSFDVMDITGKIVSPRIWLNSSQNQINLNYLQNGMYVVRFYNNNKLLYTNKLIIIN